MLSLRSSQSTCYSAPYTNLRSFLNTVYMECVPSLLGMCQWSVSGRHKNPNALQAQQGMPHALSGTTFTDTGDLWALWPDTPATLAHSDCSHKHIYLSTYYSSPSYNQHSVWRPHVHLTGPQTKNTGYRHKTFSVVFNFLSIFSALCSLTIWPLSQRKGSIHSKWKLKTWMWKMTWANTSPVSQHSQAWKRGSLWRHCLLRNTSAQVG